MRPDEEKRGLGRVFEPNARRLSVLVPALCIATVLGTTGEGSLWPFLLLFVVAVIIDTTMSRRSERGLLRDDFNALGLGIEALRIGEHNHRVPDLGAGEFGELGRAFNEMNDAVTHTIFELRGREDAFDNLNASLAEELENLKVQMLHRELAEQELAKHQDHLEDLVRERTRGLEKAQRKLLEASRSAGKAEMATRMLHEVGNSLATLMTHAGLLRSQLKNSKVSLLLKIAETLRVHERNLAKYLAKDPKGKTLPKLLLSAIDKLGKDHEALLELSLGIADQTSIVDGVVSRQSDDIGNVAVNVEVSPADLFDEVVESMIEGAEAVGASIGVDTQSGGCITADHGCLLHALEDLVQFALGSLVQVEVEVEDRRILLKSWTSTESLHFEVTDHGIGLTEESKTAVFLHATASSDDNDDNDDDDQTGRRNLHRCANSVRAAGRDAVPRFASRSRSEPRWPEQTDALPASLA